MQVKYKDKQFRAGLGSSSMTKDLGSFVLLFCQLQYKGSTSWYKMIPQDKVDKPSSGIKEEGVEKRYVTAQKLVTPFLLVYYWVNLTHVAPPYCKRGLRNAGFFPLYSYVALRDYVLQGHEDIFLYLILSVLKFCFCI